MTTRPACISSQLSRIAGFSPEPSALRSSVASDCLIRPSPYMKSVQQPVAGEITVKIGPVRAQ